MALSQQDIDDKVSFFNIRAADVARFGRIGDAVATLAPAAQASPSTLPAIFPAPATMTLGDGTVTLGRAVTLIVAPGTEPETAALVRDLLAKAGVTEIATATRLPASPDRPTIVIGPDSAALVREALSRSDASPDDAREGYTLTVLAAGRSGLITLAGHDADGLFHAAQTLRQLLARTRNLVRAKLAETFSYGTHRFTDAIDSDGHGNGPFHLRLALTREKGPNGQDRFIFDATETDDQSPGPVNLLLNPDVPGTALAMFFLGGDAGQVCNAGGPQALDEVRLREGSLLWPKWPAPLGMRGLTLMRFLAAINGLINVAGGKAPAAHSAYVIGFMRGTYRTTDGKLEPFLMSDGIGVGWGERPYADGTDAVYFVAQENYPVEFLENGYPVRLRTYGILTDSCGAGRWRSVD